jgi:hypothetical protein
MENQENSVDIAIRQLRNLQSMVFRFDVTDNDIFKEINNVISTMELARGEININYREISDKLTKHLNTGRVQE